ncbi:MAG: 5'-methylthioadenosine/adenosylhomocysteine nucleosidase [Eubacteriales bacterium]|nr:5'-methylthioadenosine/adenosylhomocysteine nucleosidase [Eubacteriales bacterium]
MKVGIIGAMEMEVARLKEQMQEPKITVRAGMSFCEGRLGLFDAVIVRSGVGKVNAAAAVQILADCFQVTHVINTGAAGSLDARINIGDIVVSTDLVQHDVDAVLFGYEPGEVPQLHTVSFPADEGLRSAAKKAVESADPDISVWEGRIASGDQFICEKEKKNWIRDTFHAVCTEMEGAAVAQTCWINHLPFVVIRAISDKADESVSISYDEFERNAAEHSARMVEYMMSNSDLFTE